jgi:PAS domain S-box-containing protein
MVSHHIFNTRHFSTLFENARIGIIVVNTNGEIVAANNYIFREFGYSKSDLLHQKVELLIPERFRELHRSHREQYSQKPVNTTVDPQKKLNGIRKDGSEFPVEMSLGYYKDKENTHFLAFVNDVSRRLEAEETIRQLNAELDHRVKESTRSLKATVDQLSRQIKENERKDEELEKALAKEKELNELKSRFVSVASHEFKTPLSGILASTYLLSKYTKENEQSQREKHIKRILSSVNILNEVLGDFLSVDKMEQNNFKPNLTIINIGAFIDEIVQNMQHMLKTGQVISCVQNKKHDTAYIDQSMLAHILTNLLSNAIKYSPEDSRIDLLVEQMNGTFSISVKDSGIGIPVNEQENLFKRFFRSSNAARIQGTGLGLNIVKRYVDILEGTIDCNSEENKGSEFIIRFNNQQKHYENSISS